MALFKEVVEAYIASRELDAASLSRLAFWTDALGNRELATLTPDDIDTALVRLAERGRLIGGKRDTAAAGKPLAGSTVNRYLTQAGSIFKHARRLKLVPRAFASPTRGIERAPERADPERYLRPEEVERLVALSRVLDKHWGKMTALIVVAYHTGLRVGSILAVRGKDLDLVAGTLTVPRTKNGDPITAGLSSAAVAELKRLPKVAADELVFANKSGKPFTYRPLWTRICAEAQLARRVFHELRHGHGYALAKAGTSQQLIMQSMGHRTLTASARYAHASVADKKAGIPPFPRTHLMMPNWQLEVFDGNEAKTEVYGRVQARGSETHTATWTIGVGGCA
ncbi:MAG: tyrosine-type recombinase/integrase [Betaproteobacteria bacterium]|nr:tyrosine-type recombinase/integrase [Betaproteobacteria bacterium]